MGDRTKFEPTEGEDGSAGVFRRGNGVVRENVSQYRRRKSVVFTRPKYCYFSFDFACVFLFQ